MLTISHQNVQIIDANYVDNLDMSIETVLTKIFWNQKRRCYRQTLNHVVSNYVLKKISRMYISTVHIKLAVPAKKNSNYGKNQWFMVLQDHIQAI